MRVILTPEGQADFERVPTSIKPRVIGVLERLQNWPDVSGAKPLRGEWKGHRRIRTGDWRVVFRVISPDVVVVRIMHRSKVYEE